MKRTAERAKTDTEAELYDTQKYLSYIDDSIDTSVNRGLFSTLVCIPVPIKDEIIHILKVNGYTSKVRHADKYFCNLTISWE